MCSYIVLSLSHLSFPLSLKSNKLFFKKMQTNKQKNQTATLSKTTPLSFLGSFMEVAGTGIKMFKTYTEQFKKFMLKKS